MNKIVELITSDPESESIQAWETVRDFIRKYPQDEYRVHMDELPTTIRKVIGVPDLIQIANNNTDQNQNFERPRFMKQYQAVRSVTIRDAIQSGNIGQIANPNKIRLLGLDSGHLLNERNLNDGRI